MRKELALLFAVLLFTNFVIAQESNPLIDLKDKSDLNVREKSNQLLEKEVQVPENLQLVTRVLFGLEEKEKISFQLFVILVAVWIFTFLLLHVFVEIMPFLEGWKSWVGGFLIMLITGISGGLKLAAQILMELSKLFGVLEGWNLLTLFISLIILVALTFLVAKLTNKLKSISRIEENRIIGENARFAGEMGKIQKEVREK